MPNADDVRVPPDRGPISLAGRVAIVTGAGNGLGRAHALALAARGAAVLVNDVGAAVDGRGRSDAAEVVVAEIERAGGRAAANQESVATPAGAQSMVDQALAELGGLDVVVANAGIQRDDSYDAYAEDDFHTMLDVHLKGTFWVTQAAYRVMREQRYGRVVFTTSGSGIYGRGGSPGYTAAKAGILGLFHGLAIEGEEHGVVVNAIAPIADTRMTAADSMRAVAARMPPEQAAALVVYLSSSACTTTHEVFEVGFGRYSRVVIARTGGWRSDRSVPTPEDVAAHLDEIRARDELVIPGSAWDDFAALLADSPDG